tara:strand:- start:54 stop:518 length:465 start_codon:yes stop_codon:yes gene_type:complete
MNPDAENSVFVSLMASPTDKNPCPPDDATMMETLCRSLMANDKMNAFVASGQIKSSLGLHPDEGVLVITKEDAAEANGVSLCEMDEDGSMDTYRFMIQLSFYVCDAERAVETGLPSTITKLLLQSWNVAHVMGDLPLAVGASWRLGEETGVVEF